MPTSRFLSYTASLNDITLTHIIMADNFLERQRRDYEERKRMWLGTKTVTKTSVAEIMKRARERFNDD